MWPASWRRRRRRTGGRTVGRSAVVAAVGGMRTATAAGANPNLEFKKFDSKFIKGKLFISEKT